MKKIREWQQIFLVLMCSSRWDGRGSDGLTNLQWTLQGRKGWEWLIDIINQWLEVDDCVLKGVWPLCFWMSTLLSPLSFVSKKSPFLPPCTKTSHTFAGCHWNSEWGATASRAHVNDLAPQWGQNVGLASTSSATLGVYALFSLQFCTSLFRP